METVFIFTYSSSVYRYVNVYTSLTEVLFCPFFLEPFLVGFWCCVPTGGAVLNLLFASSGTAAMGICSCEEQPFTVGPSTLREMPDNLATSVYV